jgi:hypothetical protein
MTSLFSIWNKNEYEYKLKEIANTWLSLFFRNNAMIRILAIELLMWAEKVKVQYVPGRINRLLSFDMIAVPVQKTEINDRGNPLRWPRDTLYPQKLALTSPTHGGRSVGIVCSRTEATEFSLVPLIRHGLHRERNRCPATIRGLYRAVA